MTADQNEFQAEDRKNLIIFIIASLCVWFAFDHFLLKPRMDALRDAQEKRAEIQAEMESGGLDMPAVDRPRNDVLAESERVKIDNGKVFGSVSLTGARIDDLKLQDYYKTHDKIEHVELLSPAGSKHPKFADFGWIAADKGVRVPDSKTVWRVNGDPDEYVVRKDEAVTLYWDNGQGLRFERTYSVDENFMFTVKQRVVNNSGRAVTLYPYGLLTEHGLPADLFGRWIIHEGPIGYVGGELIELSYKKIKKNPETVESSAEGWAGITQNYWLTVLVPDQEETSKFRFIYKPDQSGNGKERYQVDVMGEARTIQSGSSTESVTHAYLGAKKLFNIGQYERDLGVKHFDLTVDFGMYYFMTKPFYHILVGLGQVTGNFGIGIIIFTILIRLCVFPLANASYKSFAKLKQISPKMHELRDTYGDDKERLQQELVKLYEKEKVNPMAGCLPILIQIPIFFALFKVLQIAIEMRHAPFFGWIQDLSAPDPTSIFNLFGLIPWTPPEPMMIGAWPCFMLFFMLLQKQMNPPAQDKTQAMMMGFMPFFITYILSKFAAGLVIYWTFSNALSVVQQYVIMRNMGVEVHWFKKPKEDKDMEEEVKKGPSVHPEVGVIEDHVEKALFDEPLEADKDDPKTVTPPKKKKKSKKKK